MFEYTKWKYPLWLIKEKTVLIWKWNIERVILYDSSYNIGVFNPIGWTVLAGFVAESV